MTQETKSKTLADPLKPVATAWTKNGVMVNAFPFPPGDPTEWDRYGDWAAKGYSREPLFAGPVAPALAALPDLVQRITIAYEQGVGHALRTELSNPYSAETAEYQAWDRGREQGRRQRAAPAQAASQCCGGGPLTEFCCGKPGPTALASSEPTDDSLSPAEILRTAEAHWYVKERVRNFDAVGFARAVLALRDAA